MPLHWFTAVTPAFWVQSNIDGCPQNQALMCYLVPCLTIQYNLLLLFINQSRPRGPTDFGTGPFHHVLRALSAQSRVTMIYRLETDLFEPRIYVTDLLASRAPVNNDLRSQKHYIPAITRMATLTGLYHTICSNSPDESIVIAKCWHMSMLPARWPNKAGVVKLVFDLKLSDYES